MLSFKSSTFRAIGILGIAGGLLLGSALAASADPGAGGQLAGSPPLPPSPGKVQIAATGIKTVQPNGEVVLDDFTPPPARSTASADSLKANGGATRGGTAGHSASGDLKGGPGCSIQCITSGVAYAHGVNAELVVHTDTASTIWISVWNDDGYARIFNSSAGKMSFSALFDDLEPGTTYGAMAAAQDGAGYTSYAYGSFTTLTRNVQITFTEAQIEDAPYGNNDFYMLRWLQGEQLEDSYVGPLTPEGSTVPLGINIFSLDDVDQFLSLAVQLSQSDDGDDLCEAVAEPDEPSSGSSDCTTWAYATFSDGGLLDLDHRPADATSWTHHEIDATLVLPGGGALPPGYGQPLDFTVAVGISVTYE
jgi:hypothetical protein